MTAVIKMEGLKWQKNRDEKDLEYKDRVAEV